MVRALDLATLNHQIGHHEVDNALRQIALVLQQFIEHIPNVYAGRLNGSDFALIVSGNLDAEGLATDVAHQLAEKLDNNGLQTLALPVAACTYSAEEKRSELMSKLDGALAQAELKGNRAVVTLATNATTQHRNLNEWRTAILHALTEEKLELASFPVKEAHGDILHFEAPVRLQLDGQLQPAGYFVHWAARLGLIPRIDLEVVKTALRQLAHLKLPLAINISADSLCNADFRAQVIALLTSASDEAKDLWLDFPESCALRHMAEFRAFSAQLRSFGCRVGLEHVGLELTHIRELQDIGLHYLKVDSAIVRDIDTNAGNQPFLQNLCKIGHSLGFTMIAEGVNSEAEKQMLFKLGMDAVTGPGV
jgi:EAL domain-containing protein (putative c-di-GMP-specific phosphodiesterase class I)/GGDEF domain-containing protein